MEEIQGSLMELGKRFSYVTQDIRNTGKYEIGLEDLAKLIKPEWIAVDVGAHIGYFTLMLSKLCKKVYAFEPERDNYNNLVHNINLNGYKNIETFPFAVGNKNDMIDLYQSDICTGMNRVFKDEFTRKYSSYQVRMVMLDQLIPYADFVKIDVEGYEIEVLKGMKNLLKHVKVLKIEHDEMYVPQKIEPYLKDFDIIKHYGEPNYTCIRKHFSF